MAKWNDLPWREDVYKAAEQWRDKCFFNDGSIFDHGNIWTRENILTLKKLILDDPNFGGNKDFLEKLEPQLAKASEESILLMAEIMWFIYLFPIGRQPVPDSPSQKITLSTNWKTKKANISRILSWTGRTLPSTSVTSTNALSGIGRTGGQPYNYYFTALQYFLPVLLDWKQLPLSKRLTYKDASRCWDLAELLDKQIGKKSPPWRHALLFFLYPDNFERIVSAGHKKKIIRLHKYMPRPAVEHFVNNGDFSYLLSVDRAIFDVRQSLGHQGFKPSFDFYLEFLNDNAKHRISDKISDKEVLSQMHQRLAADKTLPLNKIPPSLEELEEKDSKLFTEGEKRLYTHYHRERCSTLRKCKIERMIKEHGALICECCGTKAETYQKLRRQRIFEVHHKKPLSDGLTINGIDDLALLCANCHRGIHASDPLMSVEDFKAECGFE